MKFRRTCATAALGALMALGAGGTAVADDDMNETIEISGKTFESRSESGSVTISPSADGVTTFAANTVWRGTSYSLNDHYTDVTYYGEARARANIYNGNRVVAAKFRYKRGGKNLTGGWVTSSASVNSRCGWSAGPAKGKTVYDSLDPNAPQTKWGYDFNFVNRGAC